MNLTHVAACESTKSIKEDNYSKCDQRGINMPTVSKYALIFKNRMQSFEEDLEMIDILCKAQKQDDLLSDTNLLFKYLNPSVHKAIARRSNTRRSKMIVVNHLRRTIYVSYVKDAYEEVSLYLKSFVAEAAIKAKKKETAYRLLGDQKITLNARDILQYRDINELGSFIAEQIVQDLEKERSTKSLIAKVINKTGISVEQQIIDEAMPYLEMRHKFVHTDGLVDEQFKADYPMLSFDAYNYIALNKTILSQLEIKLTKLVNAIDSDAISKGILMPNT